MNRTSTSVGGVGWSFGFHEYTTRWGGCQHDDSPQSRVDPSWRTLLESPALAAVDLQVLRSLSEPLIDRDHWVSNGHHVPICSVNTWNARSVEPCTVTV